MSGRPPTRAPRATTPDDGRARSLWREIVDDPFALGAFAAGLVILATPWLVPMTRAAWGAGLDLLLLLPIVLAIFTFGIGTPSGRRERLFWRLIAGAAASWWLAALLAYPGLAWVDRGATTYGLLIAAAYLALLLALETRPDLSRRLSLPERLDVLSDLVLVAGLFAYFMWRPEPSAVEPAALSRQVLHLTLDCVLTVRFAGLALSLPAHRRRWRALYGSLAAVGIGFAIFNIAPLVLEVDGFGWPPWTTRLPMIAGVAALGTVARLRRRHLPADDRVPQPRFSSLFLAYAFLFPMLHFGLSRLGVLDPVLQPTREWIVLGAIGLLGLLAILEQNLLRQRSAYLEERHRRDMRQAEEREQFSSSLIEHSPLAIVVLDAQHKVKLINPAFQQLFGFDPQEVEGASLDDLIATSRTADEAADYTRRVLAGAAVHRVARRRRKDGQEVDVEIHGVPLLVDGDLVGVVAIYQDITERLRTEQARSESEQRFRLLSDATFEGIVLSDDRMVMDCNTQFARIAGRRPDEIVGLPVLNFVAPEDQARVSDAMRRGLDRPYEHLLVTGTGELRTVEVHARSIGYGGRQVRVAAVRDITEARRWEQEERQAQKMEAVGRLAGGIAHDFNNVLTVIKGYGQLLALQLGEGRAREHVREINQAADRAGLMTQRLLAFGRKQALQPTILDLSAVVRGMEQMLRRLIRADIDLEVDTSGDAGRVQADPGQIEQVILNLAI
ncbi:MAG: PAS domain S-box protein, partial [Acidobacteriota bacterium]